MGAWVCSTAGDNVLDGDVVKLDAVITRITHESGRPQAAARVVLLVLSHDMFRKGLLKTLMDIELLTSFQSFMCFFMLLYHGSPLSCDKYKVLFEKSPFVQNNGLYERNASTICYFARMTL